MRRRCVGLRNWWVDLQQRKRLRLAPGRLTVITACIGDLDWRAPVLLPCRLACQVLMSTAQQRDRAEALFAQAASRSTLSETYLNYAALLESEGRRDEAKYWAQQVLAKKPGMPGFQKRRERPSFRKAAAMLKRLN